MTRFLLALRCFFAVLLRSPLPLEAMALLLPAGRKPERREPAPVDADVLVTPPPGGSGKADRKPEAAHGAAAPGRAAPEAATAAVRPPAGSPAGSIEAKPAAVSVPVVAVSTSELAPGAPLEPAAQADQRRRGAVQVLAMLQREGRLLDFLSEDIDSYTDGQIGAAVRDIHRGCRKALAEHVKLAPIRPEPDEAVVRIAAGHDASQVRLIGQVSGRPPFEGTLRHHGWRSTQINLPDIPAGHDPTVICPAEVEIGG